MRWKSIVFLMAFLCVGSGFTVRADVVLETVTWDSGTEGWTSRDDLGVVSHTGSTLAFTFTGLGSPAMQTDAVIADDLAGFNGNYTAIPRLGVSFDWYTYASSAQSLYFTSTSGASWGYDLTGGVNGWQTYSVSFGSDTGWTRLSGAGSYFDALADVNRIGLIVSHLNTGSDIVYQLDNWEFNVPEPGSIAMLFVTFGSTGFAFLRRRKAMTVPEDALLS